MSCNSNIEVILYGNIHIITCTLPWNRAQLFNDLTITKDTHIIKTETRSVAIGICNT